MALKTHSLATMIAMKTISLAATGGGRLGLKFPKNLIISICPTWNPAEMIHSSPRIHSAKGHTYKASVVNNQWPLFNITPPEPEVVLKLTGG